MCVCVCVCWQATCVFACACMLVRKASDTLARIVAESMSATLSSPFWCACLVPFLAVCVGARPGYAVGATMSVGVLVMLIRRDGQSKPSGPGVWDVCVAAIALIAVCVSVAGPTDVTSHHAADAIASRLTHTAPRPSCVDLLGSGGGAWSLHAHTHTAVWQPPWQTRQACRHCWRSPHTGAVDAVYIGDSVRGAARSVFGYRLFIGGILPSSSSCSPCCHPRSKYGICFGRRLR